MNMKLLEFVKPLSIYHGCFTWKTFWGENFALGEFTPVNMKNRCCRNVRKHKEIKNGEKYITFYISLKIGSLEKMKIASSDPKDKLGRSGKGLIISLGLKTNVMFKKNERYSITNVSMKFFKGLSSSLKG